MALGELKGPEIGELLKVLEQDWIASGFALGRDELLARARARMKPPPSARRS